MQFSTENPCTKFYFPEQEGTPDSEQAWVKLRPVSTDKVREIIKQAKQVKVGFRAVGEDDKAALKQVQWEEMDVDIIYTEMWDYSIVDWGHIEVNGQPLPCSRENKLLLIGNDIRFATNLIEWRKELEKDHVALVELLEKNSLSTSIDLSTSLPASPASNSGLSTEKNQTVPPVSQS